MNDKYDMIQNLRKKKHLQRVKWVFTIVAYFENSSFKTLHYNYFRHQ